MPVKNSAECSMGAFCNTFGMHSAIIRFEVIIFVFFGVAAKNRFYCISIVHLQTMFLGCYFAWSGMYVQSSFMCQTRFHFAVILRHLFPMNCLNYRLTSYVKHSLENERKCLQSTVTCCFMSHGVQSHCGRMWLYVSRRVSTWAEVNVS